MGRVHLFLHDCDWLLVKSRGSYSQYYTHTHRDFSLNMDTFSFILSTLAAHLSTRADFSFSE